MILEMVGFNLNQVGTFWKKDHEQKESPREEEQDELDASEFEDEEEQPKHIKTRRPKDTNFTQQRIAAWNPILTPKSVVPLYLIVAVVCVIVGGCLLSISSKVSEITIYYQNCTQEAPTGNTWSDMPSDRYTLIFTGNTTSHVAPQWRYVSDPTDTSEESGTCQIRFTTPQEITSDFYVNYMLENFAANHRRYVLSFSEDQIRGRRASYADIHENAGINCKVLGRDSDDNMIYPCGLIANSMFNDSFPFQLTNVQNPSNNYSLTNKGINWHTDRERFGRTHYNHTEVVPPPYWRSVYPNGYNETNMPDVNNWEEFQNWMRPAAFDKFAKLIRRNENDSLPAGQYQLDIGLHWPVAHFDGKKAVYMTHGSSIGSRNYSLGVVYLIGGCICAAFAIVLLGFWLLSGRKIADPKYLSWNQ